jgi:hypothetical protein
MLTAFLGNADLLQLESAKSAPPRNDQRLLRDQDTYLYLIVLPCVPDVGLTTLRCFNSSIDRRVGSGDGAWKK